MKVNAALSAIYAQGFDAQTVVNWAREYEAAGHPARLAYQRALNEFVAGQPEFAEPLGKITRLIDASDPQTVAKYDTALSAYISTGDEAEIAALAPMIVRDGVALAQRNGEVGDGSITADTAQAALGFAVTDDALAPSGPHAVAFQHPSAPPAVSAGLNPSQVSGSPRVADKEAWNPAFDGSRLNAWNDGGTIGQARTLVPHPNAVSGSD